MFVFKSDFQTLVVVLERSKNFSFSYFVTCVHWYIYKFMLTHYVIIVENGCNLHTIFQTVSVKLITEQRCGPVTFAINGTRWVTCRCTALFLLISITSCKKYNLCEQPANWCRTVYQSEQFMCRLILLPQFKMWVC